MNDNLSEMPINRECKKCGYMHAIGLDCPGPNAVFGVYEDPTTSPAPSAGSVCPTCGGTASPSFVLRGGDENMHGAKMVKCLDPWHSAESGKEGETKCGTAQSADISTSDALRHTATNASSFGELLLEWNLLSKDSQEKVQKWFDLATEHLQAILDAPPMTPAPAQGAEEIDELLPFTYAYRYPDAIRFDTGGKEINGCQPSQAIPLYDKESILIAIAHVTAQKDRVTVDEPLSKLIGELKVELAAKESEIERLRQALAARDREKEPK